jgi:hypothetical protein
MADHGDSKKQALCHLLKVCLEAARIEVIRRFQAQGRPLSIEVQNLLVKDNPGGGLIFARTVDKASGIYRFDARQAISDNSVHNRHLGLRDQLIPLAEYLIQHTDISTKRYNNLLGSDPIDGLLFHCIFPLTLNYLMSLTDLTRPRPALVNKLADDLYYVATSDVIEHVYHLTIGGVRPKFSYKYRDVSMRLLSPRERGAWAAMSMPFADSYYPLADSDYEILASRPLFPPSALIEITTTRPVGQTDDNSFLVNKVALAFYLSNYALSSTGFINHFDRPVWASVSGETAVPFPISEPELESPTGFDDARITKRQFSQVVDLAHKIPDFSSAETNAQEITLWRVLRGCGTNSLDSAFIDFAIALEAALLRQRGSELAYRFSLYGSLFLRPELDPVGTFKRLKEIYSVRSKLVHGGSVHADMRDRANQDAAELGKAVTRKAVESGWPDADALDKLAVDGSLYVA